MQLNVREQIEAIELQPGRPLVVCDADEVLFEFMQTFLGFLARQAYYFDWRSIALTGNVRRCDDDGALSPREVRDLIAEFFERHTEDMPSVAGAAPGLARLREAGAQIVILSNLPQAQRERRARALAASDMHYPLIANSGLKGPAVRTLAEAADAPTAFIDDIPHHHDSVARHASSVHRLHYSAHARLRALQRPEANAHVHADGWETLACEAIERLGLRASGEPSRSNR